MPRQQDIRRLDAQGIPHAEIARRLGIDRGTVAKYAGMEDCSPKQPRRRRVPSMLDGFKPLIDEWLEADRLMPRKQRHTAKRVYERLRTERGFEGSYSTVLRYVREWRQGNREPGDGYVELGWAPGSVRTELRSGACPPGRRVGRRPLPGRHVPALEQTVRRLAARGELGMHLRGAHGRVRAYRRRSAHAGDAATRPAPGIGIPKARSRSPACSRRSSRITGSTCASATRAQVMRRAAWRTRSASRVRNLMVPPLGAESHEQLTRLMLARCDELGRGIHYRTLDPIDDLSARRSQGAAPPALVQVRPGEMGDAQGRQVRRRRDRLQPVQHRPRHARPTTRHRRTRHPDHGQGPGRAYGGRPQTRLRQKPAHDPGPGQGVPPDRLQATRVA